MNEPSPAPPIVPPRPFDDAPRATPGGCGRPVLIGCGLAAILLIAVRQAGERIGVEHPFDVAFGALSVGDVANHATQHRHAPIGIAQRFGRDAYRHRTPTGSGQRQLERDRSRFANGPIHGAYQRFMVFGGHEPHELLCADRGTHRIEAEDREAAGRTMQHRRSWIEIERSHAGQRVSLRQPVTTGGQFELHAGHAAQAPDALDQQRPVRRPDEKVGGPASERAANRLFVIDVGQQQQRNAGEPRAQFARQRAEDFAAGADRRHVDDQEIGNGRRIMRQSGQRCAGMHLVARLAQDGGGGRTPFGVRIDENDHRVLFHRGWGGCPDLLVACRLRADFRKVPIDRRRSRQACAHRLLASSLVFVPRSGRFSPAHRPFVICRP